MLKKWISSWLDDAPQNQPTAQRSKINLKRMIVSHEEMKTKLEYALIEAKNDVSIEAMDIERLDKCDYGKWLMSEAKGEYSQTKEYLNALEAHTFYHQIAVDIIDTHLEGNTKKAKRLLSSSFKEASNLNQIECVRLYNLTLS